MRTQLLAGLSVLALASVALAQGNDGAAKPAGTKAHAVLLEGLGDYHFAVTTEAPRAQQFFDQGLRMIYPFNLEEAQRALEEAARVQAELKEAWKRADFELTTSWY